MKKKLMKSSGLRQAFQLCLLKFKLRTNKALSLKYFNEFIPVKQD